MITPKSGPPQADLAAWLWLVLALAVSVADGARVELDLSGNWQYQKNSRTNYPPPNAWQTNAVPGYLSGRQYEHAWFRKTFALPSSVAGTRLRLRFGGVKFDSKIWLNGTYVGGYLNGYEPFELDITAAALVGQTNELLVGVTDWTATFSQPVDFSNLAPSENPRDHARNTLLAPIGGRYDLYGIWQPVQVLSVPSVAVADVFVMPSVRNQQLIVRLTLRNDASKARSATVSNRVLAAGTAVVALPVQAVVVPPGATTNLEVRTAWSNPHLWSHLDPYLYSLETTVASAGGTMDQVNTRFGFREFWCETDRFYLNGTPIHLLASATWPPGTLLTEDQMRKVLLDVKAGNNVALRLHTQPWDERWYKLADEVGVLLIEECAVWCDSYSYRLADPVFWTNYARHLTGAVKRDWNHPSIVLWSLENELLSCGGAKASANCEAQLAAMGRLVKSLDPTRPITFESDLDPGGEAHVIGLHYPHEYPDFAVWPTTARWMDQPIARDWVPGGKWQWDHSKPLYIGEFLWVPGTSAADFTILFGDDAYTDPATYRNLAKAQIWRMQTEAYRAYGVNGHCPWTMFEDPAIPWNDFDLHPESNLLYQAQKAAYDPNAVFVEEYNPRFFAGETVQRALHIYNDRPTTGNFTLKWRPGAGAWQTSSFALAPADQRRQVISFTVPATNGSFALQFELANGTNTVFTNSIACAAFSRPTLSVPAGCRLGVYDPGGAVTRLLARFHLPFTKVGDLGSAAYDQLDLLVVGRAALTNETIPEIGNDGVAGRWQNFMSRGGWVVVLEQTNYPSWMPGELRLGNFDASYAFPNADHPITQGLTAADLRWWAGDHRLATNALAVPARGNFRVLAAIGSGRGLEYAGAVEVPVGLGGLIGSQLLVTERFDVEPLAGQLLQRILTYCTRTTGHLVPQPAALLANTNSAAAIKLTELGLLAENVSGGLAACDPAHHPVLIVAGDAAPWLEATQGLSNLVSFVERGGRLLLHRPSSAFLAAAQPVLFPQLDAVDTTPGLVLRRDATNAVARLTSHDLYWVEHAGQWNQAEVLSTNVARRIYRKRFDLSIYNTIQIEDMPIHSTGGSAAGGWWLWSNGYVAQSITNTQAGPYLFSVAARGTPALGGWPQMSLKIDGLVQDSISVTSTQLASYTLLADLTPGPHQLALSFDNDACVPPEDRNLFLDEIRWGRDTDTSTALLTKPGAVAQVRRGNGVLVLDEILWEQETHNQVKAGRLASTLLTSLGASQRLPPALGIEAPSMSNVNVAAYSAANGIAYVSSDGQIQIPVRFTATGHYTFDLLADGSSAQGVWPLVALLIDGVTQRTFSVTSATMSHYAFTLGVTAGQHTLALAFLNDYYAPPEDRNVAFERLTITAGR